MGVKNLWTILSGVGELTDLREMQGKRVAVDLAGWIVQSNQCRAMGNQVKKPHLRNVFFRVAALQALNIYPIFVFDGDAPALKQQTLQVRRAAEHSQSQTQTQSTESVSLSRNRLKSVMGECRALLSALGFECVYSTGEAEAMCAKLNADGQVDAVITEDSDAFCYGAETVLRNFSIAATGNSVEVYSISRLQDLLGLTRDRLIFMALLLGCDFFPTGIPGVGKELIHQLFSLWPKRWNTISALKLWSKKGFPFEDKKGKNANIHKCTDCLEKEDHCTDCYEWMRKVSDGECHCELLSNVDAFKVENTIKKKCSTVESTWWRNEFPKIVDEFETEQIPPALRKHSTLEQPKFDQCVDLLVKKLAWTEEYAIEKMIPIMTRWQVKSICDNPSRNCVDDVIKAEKILKKRVRDGNPSFDVEWSSNGENSKYLQSKFESCEPGVYLRIAYPHLIEEFESGLKAKKKPSKSKLTRQPSVEPTQALSQQPAITQFFNQGKFQSKPVEKTKETKARSKVQEKPAKNVQAMFKNVAKAKPVISIEEDLRASSPILVNRNVQRLQHSIIMEMSVDQSNDTIDSDLSMIIDDFISRKTGQVVELKQPVNPMVTSTPHGRITRPTIKPVETEACQKELLEKVENELSMMSFKDGNDTFDRMCQ